MLGDARKGVGDFRSELLGRISSELRGDWMPAIPIDAISLTGFGKRTTKISEVSFSSLQMGRFIAAMIKNKLVRVWRWFDCVMTPINRSYLADSMISDLNKGPYTCQPERRA